MKVKFAFFCFLLLNFQNLKVFSQEWFDGSLVLADRQVMVGQISLERKHDLVLFQRDNFRMVYPAHHITSVFFYDSADDINRRYISLEENAGMRTHHYLYEVIVAGEMDVLRKIKPSAFSTHDDALDYNYFILYNDVITPLGKFKRKIYPHLQSRSDGRLEEFVSINRLSTDRPVNAIRIIEYYNSIAKTEPIARY